MEMSSLAPNTIEIAFQHCALMALLAYLTATFANDKFVYRWYPTLCLVVCSSAFARMGIALWLVMMLTVIVGAVMHMSNHRRSRKR